MEGFIEMKGYPQYFINNKGDIYSQKYGNLLTPRKNRDGYLFIEFEINGKKYYRRIHRLVAENFLPEAHTKETVNHKNFDKTDNRVENLEWMTNLENIRHGIDGGRIGRGGSKPRPFGDTKICKKCGIDKSMDEFGKGIGVGGRKSRCKDCEKERMEDFYKSVNRKRYLEKNKNRKRYNSKYAI